MTTMIDRGKRIAPEGIELLSTYCIYATKIHEKYIRKKIKEEESNVFDEGVGPGHAYFKSSIFDVLLRIR